MTNALKQHLQNLHLSGLLSSLELRLQEAEANRLPHAQFLELLLQDEINVRHQRMLARRHKSADFRESRSLENFDFSFNPSIKRAQIYELAAGHFVRPHRDVLLVGAPGVGTMPGTGLCRVTWHFPSSDRLLARHIPVAVTSHFRSSESTICALNDSVINFACKVRGAPMRRPAQSPHRIVSSKTGRVRLHAGPGPVPSAVLCEA